MDNIPPFIIPFQEGMDLLRFTPYEVAEASNRYPTPIALPASLLPATKPEQEEE